jgi:hypothetical protein
MNKINTNNPLTGAFWRILFRLIAFPFFAGIALIATVVLWLKYCLNFLRFGGEAIAYTRENGEKTLGNMYYEFMQGVNHSENDIK